MSTAKKMFLEPGQQVPCIGLPANLEIDDLLLIPSAYDQLTDDLAATGSGSAFVFVSNLKELEAHSNQLLALSKQSQSFWVFYPKKPHLATDLSRDVTWGALKKMGIQGTRQVGISDQWSCMYCKGA